MIVSFSCLERHNNEFWDLHRHLITARNVPSECLTRQLLSDASCIHSLHVRLLAHAARYSSWASYKKKRLEKEIETGFYTKSVQAILVL